MRIGEQLSLLAKSKGITQEKLAEHVKVSRISVNRFFCGHTHIRSDDFVNILNALGIDVVASINIELSKTAGGLQHEQRRE